MKSVANASFNDSSICDSFVFSSGLNTESLPAIGFSSPSSVPKTIDEPSSRVSILYESISTSSNTLNGNGLFNVGSFLDRNLR